MMVVCLVDKLVAKKAFQLVDSMVVKTAAYSACLMVLNWADNWADKKVGCSEQLWAGYLVGRMVARKAFRLVVH